MKTHISLWQLAHKLGAYPDLLFGLCQLFDIRVETHGRGRAVTLADADILKLHLDNWRIRPKISAIVGRPRKPRRRRLRIAKGTRTEPKHAAPVLRIVGGD